MNKIFRGGLLPLPKDNRDFSNQKVFGSMRTPDVDFEIGKPICIEDQKTTDYCAGMAASSVAEDHEGVDLDPIWPFAVAKSIDKRFNKWGTDLRTMCRASCKVGFIEKKDSPYTIDDPRDKIVYLNNWPSELLEKAQEHRQRSYFRVDDRGSPFESIRQALWQHREEKHSVITGVMWREGWEEAEGGIIPVDETVQWFGHALKIYGQKVFDGKPYLKAQLSNGEEIGDKGIFYFPKEVVDRDFTFGAFQFNDMSPEDARKSAWGILRQVLETIKAFLNDL